MFSQISSMFPKRIHAVTSNGFILKLVLLRGYPLTPVIYVHLIKNTKVKQKNMSIYCNRIQIIYHIFVI